MWKWETSLKVWFESIPTLKVFGEENKNWNTDERHVIGVGNKSIIRLPNNLRCNPIQIHLFPAGQEVRHTTFNRGMLGAVPRQGTI